MDIFIQILIGVACIITMLLSLLGNGLVITVILRYKRLKNATNYVLLSLAIADLTVSLLVMIPAMTQDVLQKWIFSDLFCKFYNAFDVTCCTASILHLLLVAIDRYIAIFKPLTYKNMIRKWHVLFMVISIWTLSLCMSFIPIFFGWNNTSELNNSSNKLESYNISLDIFLNYTQNEGKLCLLEANVPFALISSSLSFYIPLIIMITVYFRIYIVAKRQAKSIAQIQLHSRNFKNQNQNNSNNVHTKNTDEILNDKEIKQILIQNGECRATDDKIDKTSRILKLIKSLRNIEKKRTRDTKAVKTVGIIMGIFIICWLPFFIMYCAVPIIKLNDQKYNPPYIVERFITWIGYVNSFINPIVYAFTYRDFRKAYISTIKIIVSKICPKSFFGTNTYQDGFNDDLKNANPSKKFNRIFKFFSKNNKMDKKNFSSDKTNNNNNNRYNVNEVKEESYLKLINKNKLVKNITNEESKTNINLNNSERKDTESVNNAIKIKCNHSIKYNRHSFSIDLSESSSSFDREFEDENLKTTKLLDLNTSNNKFKPNSKLKKYFSVKITKNEIKEKRSENKETDLNEENQNIENIEIYRL